MSLNAKTGVFYGVMLEAKDDSISKLKQLAISKGLAKEENDYDGLELTNIFFSAFKYVNIKYVFADDYPDNTFFIYLDSTHIFDELNYNSVLPTKLVNDFTVDEEVELKEIIKLLNVEYHKIGWYFYKYVN